MIKQEIESYISSLEVNKGREIQLLHKLIVVAAPQAKLWFLEGKNSLGKVVANPNIGYGSCTLPLAGGKSREFYKIGLSATSKGISVYIMGIKDKEYLSKTYSSKIGKTKITGYCIQFNKLKDINVEELICAVKTELES